MFEQACYEADVQWHERRAEADNGAAVIDWEGHKKPCWLEDAAQARAHNQPEPEKPLPAWKKTVTATPFAVGQPYEITTHSGPKRVTDEVLILPPIQAYGVENFAPGVMAITRRTSDGGYWDCDITDTMPHGWIGTWKGRKVEKNEDMGWGNKRRSFYFDRGAE